MSLPTPHLRRPLSCEVAQRPPPPAHAAQPTAPTPPLHRSCSLARTRPARGSRRAARHGGRGGGTRRVRLVRGGGGGNTSISRALRGVTGSSPSVWQRGGGCDLAHISHFPLRGRHAGGAGVRTRRRAALASRRGPGARWRCAARGAAARGKSVCCRSNAGGTARWSNAGGTARWSNPPRRRPLPADARAGAGRRGAPAPRGSAPRAPPERRGPTTWQRPAPVTAPPARPNLPRLPRPPPAPGTALPLLRTHAMLHARVRARVRAGVRAGVRDEACPISTG